MPYLMNTLPITELETRALDFRRRFAPGVTGPLGVDRIEEILEFKLDLEIQPVDGLIARAGTRAALSLDGRHILVDAEFQCRLSLDYCQVMLHEGCHGLLHRHLLPKRMPGAGDVGAAFTSFHKSIDRGTYAVLEAEATELAHRIAMPTPELSHVFSRARARARDYGASVFDLQFDPERHAAVTVAEHFGVTTRWAQARLRELWRRERTRSELAIATRAAA